LRGAARAVAVLAVAAFGGACQTVDLGSPPADVNACRPSQAYFVQVIWPEVLAKDYGGKKCFDSSCHDTVGRGSLALIPNPQPPLDPTMAPPMPLPDDWAKNYRATAEQMSCADALSSKLVIYPTATAMHGGGKLFDINSPQVTDIKMWVTAP
jgi:hypothetical protein